MIARTTKKFKTFWLVINKKTGEALHAPELKKRWAIVWRHSGTLMLIRKDTIVIPVRECPGAVKRKKNVDGRRRYWWVAIRNGSAMPLLKPRPTNSKATMIKRLQDTQRFPQNFRVVKMVQV